MDVYEELIRERDAGRRTALAVIVNTVGSIPSYSTAKMLVREDGSIVGTVGGGAAEAEVIHHARQVIDSGRPEMLSFKLRENPDMDSGMVCGGSLDIFIEAILPQPTLYLFGAGHVGEVTARAAAIVGLNTVVIDDRAEFANAARFPTATAIHAGPFAESMAALAPNAQALIFIATRCHELDGEVLRWAVGTRAGYIGMIGSKRKVLTIHDRLTGEGVPSEAFARVRAPVGLDIGAKTPEEIAFSVVAEMIAHIRDAGPANRLSRRMADLVLGGAGPERRPRRERPDFPATERTKVPEPA